MFHTSNVGNYTFPISDSIDNFKLKVRLWKEDDEVHVEECEIRWKDPKVFNMLEVQEYKADLLPDAPDYKKVLKERFDEKRRTQPKIFDMHRIFTNIDAEILERCPADAKDRFTDYDGEKSYIIEDSIKRTEKWQTGDGAVSVDGGGVSSTNVVLEKVKGGSDDFIRRIYTATPKSKCLEIKMDTRADQKSETMTSADIETLCTLVFVPPNNMSVFPDFVEPKKPYKRGKWRYTVEHASRKLKDALVSKEAETKARKLRAQFTTALSQLGNFDIVTDSKTTKVFVFGEIVMAKDFHFDSLYISYFIDLFQHWKVSPESSLSGTTQICNCKTVDVVDIAHFSYPFEFELTYEAPYDASSLETFEFQQQPLLYFDVMSRDVWTRHRCEGYTYTRLPSTTGYHELELSCWRPKGTGVIWDLRRYFIGGTPELDDSTFSNIPTAHEGSFLSRFGFSTESTGSLFVRMHIVHQTVPTSKDRDQKGLRAPGFKDRLQGVQNRVEIMEALGSYQRARERLRLARASMQPHYGEALSRLRSMAVDDDQGDSDRNSTVSTDNLLDQYASLTSKMS